MKREDSWRLNRWEDGRKSPPCKLVKSGEVLMLIQRLAGDYFTSLGQKEKTKSGAGGTLTPSTRENKADFTKRSPRSAVLVTQLQALAI